MTKQQSKKCGGRPKELEDPKKILLIIEKDDLEQVKAIAENLGATVQAVIRSYIKYGLAQGDAK